tara:strand:- start:20 stop:226 length:207 start_codon:yes stop_codon:yes gene_type:complete
MALSTLAVVVVEMSTLVVQVALAATAAAELVEELLPIRLQGLQTLVAVVVLEAKTATALPDYPEVQEL